MPFSFAARCGGDFRFAPCVAETCGSPTYTPSLFVIPYSLRSKRTAPATGRGLEPNGAPGFFFAPNQRPRSSRSEPSRIKEGIRKSAFFWFVPPASPRQPFPNPCRRAALRNYSLFTCLAPAFPSHFPGAPASCSQQGRRISSPAAMRDCKTPFPRTAPPAGHRLVLNLCRRAAHQNYSLFSILYSLSQPCPFFPPERTEKQKYILFFGHLTHNSARYNIGLNLIMEGKEYGKTGSA